MNRHVVLVAEEQPHGRWHEAFGDVLVLADATVAAARGEPEAVFWVDARSHDWIEALRHERPERPLVALSLTPSESEGLRMFEAGARGYCHMLAVPPLLQQVDVVVRNGGLWVGPELMVRAAAAVSQAGAAPADALMPIDCLTPRERAVAEQVVRGASNKEVACALGITLRTVKAHMGAIFDKLGVRDRLQLVLALRKASSLGRAA